VSTSSCGAFVATPVKNEVTSASNTPAGGTSVASAAPSTPLLLMGSIFNDEGSISPLWRPLSRPFTTHFEGV
jgi:hypothetical protein